MGNTYWRTWKTGHEETTATYGDDNLHGGGAPKEVASDFQVTLYGAHTVTYGAPRTVRLSAATLQELRTLLAKAFKKFLIEKEESHLFDGCFWELTPQTGTWTSDISFGNNKDERFLTYFPSDFNPNEHVCVSMLVDPQEPAFGAFYKFPKTDGRKGIQAAMAHFTDGKFVLMEQGFAEDGEVCKAREAGDDLEPRHVFLACMPEGAVMRTCTVHAFGRVYGLCVQGPVGAMRIAMAKLNGVSLEQVRVCFLMSDVHDDDDISELTPGEPVEFTVFPQAAVVQNQ